MKAMDFLSGLKPYQLGILHRLVNKFVLVNQINIRKEIPYNQMKCRNCGHTEFVKNGTYKEQQRYKCCKCETTQFADANTALYNLKLKDKWADFVLLMLEKKDHQSCRQIADELDINIKTAHSWRHKMFSCLNSLHDFETQTELELDEVYFRFCVKGRIGREKFDEYYGDNHPDNVENKLRRVEKKMEAENYQVIFMCEHNRNDDFNFDPIKVQKKGIVSEADVERVLEEVNLDATTVITDSEPSLCAYLSKQGNVNHLTFKSSDVKKGIIKEQNIHNNNINNTMMRLRDWMKGFKGVSSKYLANYLKWFRLINLFSLDQVRSFIKETILDENLYERFRGIFINYQNFVLHS